MLFVHESCLPLCLMFHLKLSLSIWRLTDIAESFVALKIASYHLGGIFFHVETNMSAYEEMSTCFCMYTDSMNAFSFKTSPTLACIHICYDQPYRKLTIITRFSVA